MLEEAEKFASDSRLGLVLIHMSIPHGPGVYDRQTKSLTDFNFKNDWYFDNLELSDRALGDIREAMEQEGQWDRSTVIVSSDHSLRPFIMSHPHFDKRVPFLIKAANQREGLNTTKTFSALETYDLILDVLQGTATTAQQIEDRLGSTNTPSK